MAKTVFGKSVRVDLKETIEPKATALIVVDMQNDFCAPGGHYVKYGKNVEQTNRIIEPLAALIEASRDRGVLIVYVQNTQNRSGSYSAPATIALLLKRWNNDESRTLFTIDGTWGHQVVDRLRPGERDMIVKKHRPSAFVGTDLDQILRAAGRETIIVSGVVTEGCVESTARDGWLRDYYVVVAEDCIASSTPELHEAQLKLMREIYHFVVPSNELMRTWG